MCAHVTSVRGIRLLNTLPMVTSTHSKFQVKIGNPFPWISLQIFPLPMALTPFWWSLIICLNKLISYLQSDCSMLLDSLSFIYPLSSSFMDCLQALFQIETPSSCPFFGML